MKKVAQISLIDVSRNGNPSLSGPNPFKGRKEREGIYVSAFVLLGFRERPPLT